MAKTTGSKPTATLTVRIFDGRRGLINDASDVFVRILDGNQRQQFAGTLGRSIRAFKVPFYDNFGDNYAVLASKKGWVGAGYHGIKVSPERTEPIDLMLIPMKHRFNFAPARWAMLKQSHGTYCNALGGFAADAEPRWERFLSDDSPEAPIAADALNILTAMRDVHLAAGTPLDYLKGVIWDGEFTLREDRFFAWVDSTLVDEIKRAAEQGRFVREPNPGSFHPGATLSYKEKQLSEANLQFTFHENTKCSKAGFKTCVMMEPDIDYYPDLLSHGLLEVVPGFFSNTDPRTVYVMRWIASRRVAGVQEFNPPYTIEQV